MFSLPNAVILAVGVTSMIPGKVVAIPARFTVPVAMMSPLSVMMMLT